MDELEKKITEEFEKDAGKYAPDDISSVWNAIEGEKSYKKRNRLYLIAACLTFVILAAAVTGILLKGNGGFTEFSGAQSGALNPDNSEESVTFAEMHPELAALPEGYTIRYAIDIASGLMTLPETETAEWYKNVIAPAEAVLVDEVPDNMYPRYINVVIFDGDGKSKYTFSLYNNGMIALETESGGSKEWYRREIPEWNLTDVLFKDNYPDIIDLPEDASVGVAGNNGDTISLSVEDIKEIWNKAIDGGEAVYAQESSNVYNRLLTEARAYYYIGFIVFRDDDILYSVNVYDNGIVTIIATNILSSYMPPYEYYISDTGEEAYNMLAEVIKNNKEESSDEESSAEKNETLAEVHPELAALPEGYTIGYALDISSHLETVLKTEAAEWFDSVIAPAETILADSESIDNYQRYINIVINDIDGKLKYTFSFYDNGLISLETESGEKTEWYKMKIPEWNLTSQTFDDNYPELTAFPENVGVSVGDSFNNIITLSGNDFREIWNKVMDGGNAVYAQGNANILNGLMLRMKACYQILWEYNADSYSVSVYDNGLICLVNIDALSLYYDIPYEYYISDTGAEAYSMLAEVMGNDNEETSAEEGETLASRHPELAVLPENYTLNYTASNGSYNIFINTFDAAEWYENVMSPTDTVYLKDEPVSKVNIYYNISILDETKNCGYAATVYKDGLICLKKATGSSEWYKRKSYSWVLTDLTFADKNPARVEMPDNLTVYVLQSSNYSYVSGDEIKELWNKLINNGYIRYADANDNAMMGLFSQLTDSCFIQWKGPNNTFTITVYDNGFIRFEHDKNYHSVTEYYISDEVNFKISIFNELASFISKHYGEKYEGINDERTDETPDSDGMTFTEKHPELASFPEGAELTFNMERNITLTGEETAAEYERFIAPGKSVYLNSMPNDLPFPYFIFINVKISNNLIYYFTYYADGHFVYSYKDETGNHQEWYYNADFLSGGCKTFAQKHEKTFELPYNCTMTIIRAKGDKYNYLDDDMYKVSDDSTIREIYNYLIDGESMKCPEWNYPSYNGGYDYIEIAITCADPLFTVKMTVYESGWIHIMVFKDSHTAFDEFYYNPNGYDYNRIIPEGATPEDKIEFIKVQNDYTYFNGTKEYCYVRGFGDGTVAVDEYQIDGNVLEGTIVDESDEIKEFKVTDDTEFWLYTDNYYQSCSISYEDFKKLGLLDYYRCGWHFWFDSEGNLLAISEVYWG